MLIRCIFEYFQKKIQVLTINKKNGNFDKFGKRDEKLGNLQKIQRFKFERASFRSSGGRGVDRLLVMGRRDALVKGRPSYRESRYRESRVYILHYVHIIFLKCEWYATPGKFKTIRIYKFIHAQVEINNRTNVDPTLVTNFRLSSDSRNDNDVLRWYKTSFQRCINTGNQHIFNAGCQHL